MAMFGTTACVAPGGTPSAEPGVVCPSLVSKMLLEARGSTWNQASSYGS